MVARFERDVISEHPGLVLWQVGTNVVLRDHPLEPQASLLHEGLSQLKATGSDVILTDPQFAPKVLARSEITEMIDLIATTAKIEKVNLFHRFAVMRHWRLDAGVPFADFLSADQLHMNDWSYDCLAKLPFQFDCRCRNSHRIANSVKETLKSIRGCSSLKIGQHSCGRRDSAKALPLAFAREVDGLKSLALRPPRFDPMKTFRSTPDCQPRNPARPALFQKSALTRS